MSETAQTSVGVVGLGLLGSAIADRCLAAGYPVLGFDVDPGARDRAGTAGVAVCETVDEMASQTGRFVLSLPNSTVRNELLFGKADLARALPEGALLLDTTTGRPADLEADAARLRSLDIDLIDVCVLASSAQVRNEGAVLLVGDREAEAAGYRGLLQAFGRKIFYLGAPGDGSRMKLVANLALGLHRLVLAEALGLAEKAGLDGTLALEVLQSGPAASAVMATKGEKMLSGDFEPVARLAQHAKDVDLIRELGDSVGASLPVSTLHQSLLQELLAAGYGGEDNAAIIRAFRPAK